MGVMQTSVLDEKHFHDEEAAFAYLEARLWPNGPVCPRCGQHDRISKMSGKSTRIGVYKCYKCRKPFRVTVNTVFESSHVSLRLWLQAVHLMASSKKGISSNQLHRTLGVTLRTAWFMSHRIRLAMRTLGLEPMGGEGKTVEADETYIGGLETNKHRNKRLPLAQGGRTKEPVITLIERGGRAHSYHVPEVTGGNVGEILEAQLKEGGFFYTDDSNVYRAVKPRYRPTATVIHSAKEYVRGDVHTNTVEGYFSILKRGITGVYHHVSQKHLKRYLAEFDFRYSNRVKLGVNDVERADRTLKGIVGKRLTYRPPANN
jgi:transposase-like protein